MQRANNAATVRRMAPPRRVVKLDCAQVALIGNEAIRRRASAWKRGGRERFPNNKDDEWQREMNGAGAEYAVSLVTNLAWTGVHDDPGGADVGGFIEVRWRSKDGDELLVYDAAKDPDDRVVVLVVGRLPTLELCGWIYAAAARAMTDYRVVFPERTAFCIPQHELRSIAELLPPPE